MFLDYDGFEIVRAPDEPIELKPLATVEWLSILVFCPIYRIEPETVQAIMALEWGGPLDILFGRDNPYPTDDGGRANIAHQYNRARQRMLQGGYHAMLVIESDVIPPKDTLQRLAVLPADVAYGEYLFRRPYEDDQRPGEQLFSNNVYRYSVGPFPDMPLSRYPDAWVETYNQVCKCTGGGLGCALIWRKVMGKIEFRNSAATHSDTLFTQDVHRAGFTMMADRRVRCGHKMPNGAILWPSPTPGTAYFTDGITVGNRGELRDDPTKR